MGELRFYAVGLDEVSGIFGATPEVAAQLRGVAQRVLAPPTAESRGGLLGKLGPIFRRPPAAPVLSPTQPEPHDVEVLLAGAYIAPERMGATWRLVETLVCGIAWGSVRTDLNVHELTDLDFALARAGVSSAVGLQHLLNNKTGLSLIPVQGLTVGWHPHEKALAMAGAYRSAAPSIPDPAQRETVESLARWLDGFVPWARVAGTLGRPAPDLLAFYAN